MPQFVYFENFKQLEEIIEDVSKNFHNYEHIIEAAYVKSKNYTVENIYRYIQTNDKSLITWSNKHV